MKYIVFAPDDAVLFSPLINHCDLAATHGGEPLSAGFVIQDEDTGKLQCVGESITLGICSRPMDTDLVNDTLFLGRHYVNAY